MNPTSHVGMRENRRAEVREHRVSPNVVEVIVRVDDKSWSRRTRTAVPTLPKTALMCPIVSDDRFASEWGRDACTRG